MVSEKETFSEYVGEMIRFYRKKRGYSQVELASMVFKSKSTLSKYESGKISVDVDSLYDIARALDVDFCQFVDMKAKAERASLEALGPFGACEELYLYYRAPRSDQVISMVLEIKLDRAHGKQIPCCCYMDCPSVGSKRECTYFYSGLMTCCGSISHVTLANINNPMQQLSFNIFSPSAKEGESWGFTFALSSSAAKTKPMKFFVTSVPLRKEEVSLENLEFSGRELKIVDNFNLMLMNTTKS